MNGSDHENDRDGALGKGRDEDDLSSEDQTIDEAMGQTIAEQTLSESEFISKSGSASASAMGAKSPDETAVPKVEGYQVIEPLGQGGMGTVWRAIQLSTSREVALKLLGGASFMSEQARPRFEREIRLAARLEHSNIATIYDSGIERGVYYYAMQLVTGEPLDEFILKRHLKRKYILKLVQIVCGAVQHAHEQGIVHRDLKPSNIMVTSSGKPIVLDFGLAKMLGEDDEQEMTLTGVGDIAGTPAYMAPEQAEGRIEAIGPQTDVYALGAILFRMLTGDSPTDLSGSKLQVLNRIATGEVRSPNSIKPAIDHELEALLLKALSVDREDRYQSAGEMASAIAKYRDRLKQGLVTQGADDSAVGSVDDTGMSVHYSGLQTQVIKRDEDNGGVLDASAYQMKRSTGKKKSQPIALYIGGGAAALVLVLGVVIYALVSGPGDQEADDGVTVAEQTDRTSGDQGTAAASIAPVGQASVPVQPIERDELDHSPDPIASTPDVEPVTDVTPEPVIDQEPEPVVAETPTIANDVTAREAAEWVIANGGEVTVQADKLFPNSKLDWIDQPSGLPADLSKINGVRLRPTGPEQFRHLPKLAHLPGLKGLIIESGRNDLKNDPMPELAELTQLVYFRISAERTNSAFMEHLAGLENLQYMKMHYIQIEMEHFEHLREMTGLTTLSIRFTRLLNEHFTHMRWLRKLDTVDISNCTGFDYRAVHNLADLPQLTSLSLAGARLDDVGINPLMKMRQLQRLNVVKTGVSPSAVVKLQLALPDCEIMIKQGEVFKLPKDLLNKPNHNRPEDERPERPRPGDRPPRRDQER